MRYLNNILLCKALASLIVIGGCTKFRRRQRHVDGVRERPERRQNWYL